MFCETIGFSRTPDEEYWARFYFSTHTEVHFHENKSNCTRSLDLNTNGFQTQQTLLLGGKKLRTLTKAHSSPQPYVCPQSSTILLPSSLTLYKDYDQTRTTTHIRSIKRVVQGWETSPRVIILYSSQENFRYPS